LIFQAAFSLLFWLRQVTCVKYKDMPVESDEFCAMHFDAFPNMMKNETGEDIDANKAIKEAKAYLLFIPMTILSSVASMV
jgi:hypothetical protein